MGLLETLEGKAALQRLAQTGEEERFLSSFRLDFPFRGHVSGAEECHDVRGGGLAGLPPAGGRATALGVGRASGAHQARWELGSPSGGSRRMAFRRQRIKIN